MTIKKVFIIFLSLTLYSLSWGQGPRNNEDDVKAESLIIAAYKEKLLGNYDESVDNLKALIDEEENNSGAWYELSKVYTLKKEHQDALSAIQKAKQLEPQNIWYSVELAEVYGDLGDYSSAASSYEQLTKSNPNESHFYFSWATFLVKDNKQLDAIEVFNLYDKRFGINPETVQRKFALYNNLGKSGKAEFELLKLVKIYDNNTDFLHLLANFYVQTNQEKKATRTYEKILSISSQDTKAKLYMASISEPSSGGSALESLSEIFKDANISLDIKIAKLIPYISNLAQNKDESQRTLITSLAEGLTKTHSEEAKAHAIYGDVLSFLGDDDAAIEQYKKTLTYNKKVYAVWDQLMTLLYNKKDFTTLYDISEKALDYFPNEIRPVFLNGVAAGSLENYNEAINTLQHAKIMVGNNKDLDFEIDGFIDAFKKKM